MKLKINLALLLVISLIFAFTSCNKEEDPKEVQPPSSEINIESHNYIATTPEKGKLGRVLFYDKALSENGTVSCGSCHIQEFAFADNKRFSIGFEGEPTPRNTPPIQNLKNAFSALPTSPPNGQALFWDGRSRNLEDMVFEPFTNHIEMGLASPTEIIERLSVKQHYRQLFSSAYGSSEVTISKIGEALAGFVASMESHESPFEQAMTNFDLASLPSDVNEGFNLFVQTYDCMSCHDVVSNIGYVEAFGEEFVNIGLDLSPSDYGRADVTENPGDVAKFKIPNLRNIALTAPYMHDGRFETLEEVIDHYSHQVKPHENLDHRLKGFSGEPLVHNIPDEDKQKLIAFLNALTDENFVNNPAFSDPFTE